MDEEHQSFGSDIQSGHRELELDCKEQLRAIIEEGDDAAAVERLLDGHTDLDLEGPFKYRFPLHNAQLESGVTFLMLAGGLDRARIVDMLLRHGSKIDAETKNSRRTVLHFAAEANVSMSTFDLLVQRGGVELIKRQNQWEESALHLAIMYGDSDLVRLLIEMAEASSDNGKGDPILVKIFLEHNADACAKRVDGIPMLHQAVHDGDQAITRMLPESRCYPLLGKKDNCDWTALHWAAFRSDPDIVNILLERGANLYATAYDGTTALHLAASYGRPKTVKAIFNWLDRDVNLAKALRKRTKFVTAKAEEYGTALALAASEGFISVVLDILESSVFFPEYPTQNKPYFSDAREIKEVSLHLL
ncbi:ankyrin repeat domain-containing protein [Aspergillus fijiensis CBS 313.89]|uniref:Ankyrin n=1 Tax=Aspergillus fijiensis CBS 313.89 TaxID=1448319 RepID=A0A8G1RZK6_9EURO|nr:ankyrin [Aspergillus fijiensis CBS 313.89]RAK81248.1 ankyrin [Aspergillus fijiensis CBS 313.89]